MIDQAFLKHPREVGESYSQHWRTAMGFGLAMTAGGIACMVHAFVPALFTRTGSAAVKRLYGEMKRRQPELQDEPPAFLTPQWQPEYEI
jgi:hypothetical protein